MNLDSLYLKDKAKNIWRFINQFVKNFKKHELHIRASSIAYYALVSIFPLILLALYVATRVLRSEEARTALHEIIVQVFPAGVVNLELIIDQTMAARTSMGVLSALGLLWTASAAFSILEMALSVIWGTEPRPFWKRRALGAVSVIVLCITFVGSFFFRPIISWALVFFGYFGLVEAWFNNLLAFVILYTTTLLIYRIYPKRKVSWQPVMMGAFIATLLMELGRASFGLYIDIAFSNFGYVYGSIAWIVLLSLWAYLMASIFFIGAEVAVLLENSSENSP